MAIDITGHENLMLLLPNPGDELAYGPFIAELCARGRPPFVAILGDGAREGSHALANQRERESRRALAILGVPDDRILFVGLRMGSIPAECDPLFEALSTAMALLNWRKDCNVIGVGEPTGNQADLAASWQVAAAVARHYELSLVVRCGDFVETTPAETKPEEVYEFDGSAWGALATDAGAAHQGSRHKVEDIDTLSRFYVVPPTALHDLSSS